MKNKWPGTLLIIGAFILVVFVIPFALFSTLSGTFVPPAPDSMAAQLPEAPYPEVAVVSTSLEVPPAAIAEESPEAEGDAAPAPIEVWDSFQPDERVMGDAYVKKLIAAFNERHPNGPPESKRLGNRNGLSIEFCAMALAVLEGKEPSDDYFSLLQHPNALIRQAAIRGLGVAQGALAQEGSMALFRLLERTSEDNLNRLVNVAAETLVADAEARHYGSSGLTVLNCLGDYARPAIPTLVWVARNSPRSNLRIYAMNTVINLDPASSAAGALIAGRLADPSGAVRLEALHAWAILRPLRISEQNHGQVPPAHLERRPEDMFDAPANEGGAPVQKSALASAA